MLTYKSISEICCRLGYDKPGFTECIANVPRYEQIDAIRSSPQVHDAKTSEQGSVGMTKMQGELQERGEQ